MEVSDKIQTPGFSVKDNSTHFCFYCEEASQVECEIFDTYEQKKGAKKKMKIDSDGYWHLTIKENLSGKWYGYRVKHPKELAAISPYNGELFADPYSKHVTTLNRYDQRAKSYIFDDSFDWEDDRHIFPEDPRDLVIYETHLKDLTAHKSSGAKGNGYYQKFIDLNQKGGIAHLKKLGVNCVEFLPLQKFAQVEPPYGEETKEGFLNSWNPYSENYWGYMTSFFHSPETSFASDKGEKISGITTASVTEFKELVKKLHKHGITVLMDVVYNHTSLFDLNPCTHLCSHTYLRYNEKGQLMNRSGTGNEYKSEEPIARDLIISSLKHWVEEYHVDGFRFDLAALLDQKSWNVIRTEMHAINPRIVLIAEPWGGYYSPSAFSEHDWASWNDKIRNSIKGSDPQHDRGYIFSEWQHETGRGRLENVFRGTLKDGEGGLYETSMHSVNYLESHDGYTLADFIRIALQPELQDMKIEDPIAFTKLNQLQMDHSKLAALSLFSAQGITMIHAGQEFGRSKIITDSGVKDPDIGKMDHNSYQKDNETNWLNFDALAQNQELFDYYRGLIEIRRGAPALCKSVPSDIVFDHYNNPLLVTFRVSGNSTADLFDYYVILNANWASSDEVTLPPGAWELLVNKEMASSQAIDILSGTVEIPAKSGMLLRKLK